MKTKLFTASAGMFRTQIDVSSLERQMNDWLAARPQLKIVDIKHSMASGVWSYTQLVIALYYEEPAS